MQLGFGLAGGAAASITPERRAEEAEPSERRDLPVKTPLAFNLSAVVGEKRGNWEELSAKLLAQTECL